MSRAGLSVLRVLILIVGLSMAFSLAFSTVLPLAYAGHSFGRVNAAPAAGLHAEVRGSLGGSVLYQGLAGEDSRLLGVLEGRLEMRVIPAGSSAWWATVTAEPRLTLDPVGDGERVTGSAGLTEAVVGVRFDIADFYVGRLNLPLETARLTLPYTLTPPDRAGRRPGITGARTDVYLGSSRLQLAAVRVADEWAPLIGVRHAALGWEATAHLLRRGNDLVAGAGWSGLVGSTVVYGEGWSVSGEPGLRYSLGATGYMGDLLWTAEIARAAFVPGAEAEGSLAPVPLAAAQLSHAPIPGFTVVADVVFVLGSAAARGGSVALKEERPHSWGMVVAYEIVPGTSELELSMRRWVPGAHPSTFATGLGLRYFF